MNLETKNAKNMKQAMEIFEKHGNMIRAAIKSNINNKSNIDDVFQDFFISIVKKPIQQQQHMAAFFNRAIRNDILDAAFRFQHYAIINRKYAQMHNDRFKPETPVDITSHAEEIHRLLNIVKNHLLPYETEAIIQKYLLGKNVGETANLMGVKKRSVYSYICTGLKKLRKIFIFREIKALAHDND